MTTHNFSITQSHFLKKLHERKNQHLEQEKEIFQPRLEGVQSQIAQLRAISDKRAIEERRSGVNSKTRQKGQNKRPNTSQIGWKWLAMSLLVFALFSSALAYYALSSQDFTLFRETQDMFLADVSQIATRQDKLSKKPESFSKLGNLSKRSNTLSATYLSQAFFSSVEDEQREFLKVEIKLNKLLKPDIKPGPSQLMLLNSYPVAQDKPPLGNSNSILPDGLWLKENAVMNQPTNELIVAEEEHIAVEIIATEEPAVVVEEVIPNKSIEEAPVVQNSYVSPTTGTFRWPASGPISQGAHRYHMALDIAVPFGTPVLAADGGIVEQAGWDHVGYGNLIVIDHQNGYKTYYAHLSSFAVQVGASVNQGVLIGQVGSTGNSTGPHLHFEIRLNNILQNPFNFLY